MESDQNGTRPKWRNIKIEDNKNVRRLKWKTKRRFKAYLRFAGFFQCVSISGREQTNAMCKIQLYLQQWGVEKNFHSTTNHQFHFTFHHHQPPVLRFLIPHQPPFQNFQKETIQNLMLLINSFQFIQIHSNRFKQDYSRLPSYLFILYYIILVAQSEPPPTNKRKRFTTSKQTPRPPVASTT